MKLQQQHMGAVEKGWGFRLAASKKELDVRMETEKSREALEKASNKVTELEKLVPELDEQLQRAQADAESLAAAAEQKEKEKADREEATRSMSDAGACFLVELVLGKFAKKFENSSDTADSVWEKAVHPAFIQATEDGTLPSSHVTP